MLFGAAPAGLARDALRGLPAPWIGDHVEQHEVDVATLLDRRRMQANALEVLELVPEAPDCYWIGLASFDLGLPPLAYVCGVAPLGGRRGVVSWARLREGLESGDAAFRERVIKEIAHELGHAAGLPHCPVHDCVMHASIRPDEMDLKGKAYCPVCAESLVPSIG